LSLPGGHVEDEAADLVGVGEGLGRPGGLDAGPCSGDERGLVTGFVEQTDAPSGPAGLKRRHAHGVSELNPYTHAQGRTWASRQVGQRRQEVRLRMRSQMRAATIAAAVATR